MPILKQSNNSSVKKRRAKPRWLAAVSSALCITLIVDCAIIDPTQAPIDSDVGTVHSYLITGTPVDKNGNVAADVDGARIGRGYDPVLEQWLSMCVEDVGLSSLTGGTAQQVFYQVTQVDSLSEVSSSFDVSTKVKLSFGSAIEAGASFKLSLDRKMNSYRTNIMAKVTVVSQEQTMNQFLLKQWVVDEIKKDPNFIQSGKFTQLCGSNFASGYKPGGELFILFSRENTSSQEKQDVEAGLDVKIASFLAGDVSVKNELQQQLGTTKWSMYVSTLGAVTPLPSLDKVLEIVENFPVKVAEAKGWPLAVRLTPYKVVQNYPDLDSPPNWAVDRVLKSLADLRSSIMPIYFDDMYVDTHRDQFETGGLDVPALEESLRIANASLTAIEAAAKECYVNGNCSLPDPLPAIPRRPVSSATPKPDSEFRAVWRIYPECKPGLERSGGPTPDEGCKLTEICGPAGTWQGGSVRKDCVPTCKVNEDKQIIGTTMDGCNIVKLCSPAGTWSGGTTYEDCVCKPGRDKRACSCPECGNKEQACTRGDGTYSACLCNRTCPDNFSPDGGVCSWPSSEVGYQSWRCGTPEHSVFLQLDVPAECDDMGTYDCQLEFNLKDKGGSCDRSTKPVMQLECADGTPLHQYTSSEVAGGFREDKLTVPPGCKLVRARKITTEAGICASGCVRYLEDVKLKVKTKNQCTF